MENDNYVKILMTIIALVLVANLWHAGENLVKTAWGKQEERHDRGFNPMKLLDRLDAIEAQNQEILGLLNTVDTNVNDMQTEVADVQTNVAAHRSGTIDQLFDVEAAWCFKLEGSGKVASRTDFEGVFAGKGGAGVDFYGNKLLGNLQMRTKGKVDTGWEGVTGLGLNICIKGPVIKALEGSLNVASPGISQRSVEREQLVLDTTMVEAELNDRLPEILDGFGLISSRLPAAMDRSLDFDTALDDPTALLTSLMSRVREDLVNMPMPPAIRNQLNDENRGILKNISERLSSPRDIFCELEANTELPQSFRDRMGKACAADGEKFKDTIDNIQDVVDRVNSLMKDLPDEIIFGVGDIFPDPVQAKLPSPRPSNSPICDTFPRLCR